MDNHQTHDSVAGVTPSPEFVEGHEHDAHEHAGHDHEAHAGHDHAGHDAHAGHDMRAGQDAHAAHDHSHHDPGMFCRKFWLSLVLTVPTMVFSMGL